MKKYFMKETENEVQFGDIIQLDLTKRTDKGKIKHHHLEVEFQPGIVDYLIEEGIIEVKEFKEEPIKQGIIDFDFEDDEDKEDYDEEEDCLVEKLLDSISNIETTLVGLREDIKDFIAGFGKKETKDAKKGK